MWFSFCVFHLLGQCLLLSLHTPYLLCPWHLPVHHQLPEFTQTHVLWVNNAIQPSYPLSSPSPAFNLSQYQGLLQWVRWPNIGVSASALPMNIQDWFPLGWTGWISLQSKGLSRVFSNTTVQKPQFFSAQLSLWSNSHIHTWLMEKPWLWLDGLWWQRSSVSLLIFPPLTHWNNIIYSFSASAFPSIVLDYNNSTNVSWFT